LLVIKILVSKFFENKILRNPTQETRASQGFRRHRDQKISPQIRPRKPKSSRGKMLAELYFAAEIHTGIGVSNQRGPKEETRLKEI
jgi:hypothetical protein